MAEVFFWTDYFKIVIFWKKHFTKNGSFTTFWLVESRNWFMIHKSWTLNSYYVVKRDRIWKNLLRNILYYFIPIMKSVSSPRNFVIFMEDSNLYQIVYVLLRYYLKLFHDVEISGKLLLLALNELLILLYFFSVKKWMFG